MPPHMGRTSVLARVSAPRDDTEVGLSFRNSSAPLSTKMIAAAAPTTPSARPTPLRRRFTSTRAAATGKPIRPTPHGHSPAPPASRSSTTVAKASSATVDAAQPTSAQFFTCEPSAVVRAVSWRTGGAAGINASLPDHAARARRRRAPSSGQRPPPTPSRGCRDQRCGVGAHRRRRWCGQRRSGAG